MMGTAESSEKSVAFYQTTRCHISEDGGLYVLYLLCAAVQYK
jgi:hypothetical protein